MKNIKKKILAIVAGCMFAGLMMLNVSTTYGDSNFSVTGLSSLAYGTTGGGFCYTHTSCPPSSQYTGVACYGYEFCIAAPYSYVSCDGIYNWC